MTKVSEITSRAIADIIEYYKPVGGKIEEIDAQLADIPINVKQFGAKGDGVSDDTAAIQAAVNYCLTNHKDLFFPAGSFVTTAEIIITGFIRIYGCGKNTTILSKGTNLDIFKIQFATPSTRNYTFSNLEIRDITIEGNPVAAAQNVFCFNSVITIYNKLKNIRANNVNGSFIRLINDGSRTQTSFYSHNVYWVGIYLFNVSEFITQDMINSGTVPWVYGGELSDIHIEGNSSMRSKDYLFDLTGFHNMNIKDMITEGNTLTSFKSVYKCNASALFTNVYFEFVLGEGVTIESYFELGIGQFRIVNPMNLDKSCVKTTATNTIVEVEGGILKNLNSLHHPSSVGNLSVKNVSTSSWYSGSSNDDVIPYSSAMGMKNVEIGTYIFSKADYVELYRLDKGAYVSNFFGESIASQHVSGSGPVMELVKDPVYGRAIKFTPTGAKNAVFYGVKLTLPSSFIGKPYTAIARYKWQATNLEITRAGMVGSYHNLYMDNSVVQNDVWRTAGMVGNVDSSGNILVRFDYDAGQTYTNPQVLYLSEIIVVLGGFLPQLPLKDDRNVKLYGSAIPAVGAFSIGDEVINNLSVDATIHKWVYTSQGWKAIKF